MAFLSVFFGWLHVMFAVLAVGGSIFNLFILAPVLQGMDAQVAAKIGMSTTQRLTRLIWISLGGLAVTGIIRVYLDSSFSHAFGFDSDYGVVMNIKMLFFLGILVHVFLITRTGAKMGQDVPPEERKVLQRKIRRFALTNTLLAVIVIFLAVGLRYSGSIF